MHFSTVATLAVALASSALAAPADAAQTAAEDVQQHEADGIMNMATGSFLDLYLSDPKMGNLISGWYFFLAFCLFEGTS